jgi:hypothetical protein
MACQPRQHIFGLRPHNRLLAAPGQNHQQRQQIRPFAPDHNAGKMRPVHLGLSAGWRLHTATRANCRSRVRTFPETLNRSQAAVIILLGAQPLVQETEIERALLLAPPVLDSLGKLLSFEQLPRSPVDRFRLHPRYVVAHRAFTHAQKAGNLRLRRLP